MVRIARRPEPWFTNEGQATANARRADVPAPEVLGVEHVDHEGELLSFSVLRLLPGHPLDEVADELPTAELERVLVGGGELLAKLHSVGADCGTGHELAPPKPQFVDRVIGVAGQALGQEAAGIVERGVDRLVHDLRTYPPSPLVLTHGDFLPKHLLIDDHGAIVGVIDWEFAGAGPPALDLAHWEVAAGEGYEDYSDLVRRGYERVAQLEETEAGWVPGFAIHFALEVLSWRNPASPARLRRCIEVIARHTGT